MVDVPRLSATTHAFRALWLAVGTAALVWRRGANALVQEAWDVLRASAIVRHDSFEPGVVVVAFLFCLVFWKAMDCWLPEGWTRPWRLQDSADLGSWKIEKRGFRLLQEPAWYFAPLLVFDYLFPRRKLPASAPSVEQLVVEVLAALVVYDLLFFFVHVMCHKVPCLYRNVHAKHHSRRVVRAIETIRLSLFEQWADVSCSIAAVNILRCHPLSRAVYNATIVYLLTELHAGSRRHHIHHVDGRCYYQKFFTYLDNMFGFVQDSERLVEGSK